MGASLILAVSCLLGYTVIGSPDLDILDNQADLTNNTMLLHYCIPTATEETGDFKMVATASANQNANADNYDGPGDDGLRTFMVYDPDQAKKNAFSRLTTQDTVFLNGIRGSNYFITVQVYGVKTELEKGEEALFTVKLINHSELLPEGLYTTGHVVNPVNLRWRTLDPSDKIFIVASSLSGTSTFEPADSTTYKMIDWFELNVEVCNSEDIDIGTFDVQKLDSLVIPSIMPGTSDTSLSFWVYNTNETFNPDPTDGPSYDNLTDIRLQLETDLIQQMGGSVIPKGLVTITPNQIDVLNRGSKIKAELLIQIPLGQAPGKYEGYIRVFEFDNFPYARLKLSVTVDSTCDLDIGDYNENVIGNELDFTMFPGIYSDTKYFLLTNPNDASNNFDPDPYGYQSLQNLTYEITALTSDVNLPIPAGNISVEPLPAVLRNGLSIKLGVRVFADLSTKTGIYRGWLKVIDQDCGTRDSVIIKADIRPLVSVSGRVTQVGNNFGIYNASVSLYTGTTLAATGTTDGTGNYRIENLIPGEYTLVADALGRKKMSLSKINLNKSENTFEFKLAYLGDFDRSGIIDFDDIDDFAKYWNSNDERGDIGPIQSGTSPQLIIAYDNIVNHWDMAVFISMWNWSYVERNHPLLSTVKPPTTGFTPEFNNGQLVLPEAINGGKIAIKNGNAEISNPQFFHYNREVSDYTELQFFDLTQTTNTITINGQASEIWYEFVDEDGNVVSSGFIGYSAPVLAYDLYDIRGRMITRITRLAALTNGSVLANDLQLPTGIYLAKPVIDSQKTYRVLVLP